MGAPSALESLSSALQKSCIYCSELIDTDFYLDCEACTGCVHLKCLRRSSTPGDMLGDTFFNFTCANCFGPSTSTLAASEADKEKFVRHHMPWILVITITLYNLSVTSKGLSRQGYFHWRTHISSFIDKNWEYLFEPGTRRRKNWIGSISGCLSHNSPEYFVSGQEVFSELGWWKLANDKASPRYLFEAYQRDGPRRQLERQERKNIIEEQNTTIVEVAPKPEQDNDEVTQAQMLCSRMIPYMGRQPRAKNAPKFDNQTSFNTVQSNLMDFLAESLSNDDIGMYNSLSNIEVNRHATETQQEIITETDDVGVDSLFDANVFPTESQFAINDTVNNTLADYFSEYDVESEIKTENVDDDETHTDDARIVQVTYFHQRKKHDSESQLVTPIIEDDHESDREKVETSCMEDDCATITEPSKPSLFTKSNRRKYPWVLRKTAKNDMSPRKPILENQRLITMSQYEETELLMNLEKIFTFEKNNKDLKIPVHIRRFFDKLKMRKWNRRKHRPIFNLDEQLEGNVNKGYGDHNNKHILDRFQLITTSKKEVKQSFHARIVGHSHYEPFKSPYTQRVLQPFIYRNTECVPPWLKLLSEIKYTANGEIPAHASIDFCYLQPNHIAAVNALLQKMFWPGIDVTECLSCPDYSVVALYKKLVIGCGFLVPDVGFNEAYISFMAVRPGWQKSGIASFMIYHLVQTCMSKDITLHVSATNPAVVLYQKFGFKIEELCLNFYEKYLPIDSPHSRHGLFLRLSR